MTTSNWKQPDWIYVVQEKLKHLDLTKFPSRVWFTSKIIEPANNKYVPAWAICVDVRMDIRLRDNGKWTNLSNGEGVYLYSEKNFEEIIYVEFERLLVHELKECFQIQEVRPQTNGGSKSEMIIPFDPHNSKRSRIKYSTYDKVDIYRHYPSWKTLLKISFMKWCKTRADTLRAYYVNRYKAIESGFTNLLFVETKALPSPAQRVEVLTVERKTQ